MGIALQDRSHSASITRCEAVLLVSAHSPCRSMPVSGASACATSPPTRTIWPGSSSS